LIINKIKISTVKDESLSKTKAEEIPLVEESAESQGRDNNQAEVHPPADFPITFSPGGYEENEDDGCQD